MDQEPVKELEEKIEWAKTIVEEAQGVLKTVGNNKLAKKEDCETLHASAVSLEVKSCNSLIKSVAFAKKAVSAKGGS